MTCNRLPCPLKLSSPALCLALITLVECQLFAQFSTVLNIPPDPDIGDNESISSNTQVNLFDGGTIGAFVDAESSEINVFGGTVGGSFEASIASAVNISGGSVGGNLQAVGGSTITITGGLVGASLHVMSSTLNISGGSIGFGFNAISSTVNVSGGSVDNFFTASDSVVNFAGGMVAGFQALDVSSVEITGGTFGGIDFENSSMTISGDEFRLDDTPVNGIVFVPEGSLLSGTLADGTPFAFSPEDVDFSAAAATLTLQTTTLPPVGPATITASTDVVPLGIRQGQTLIVDAGGVVGDNFNAGAGSTVVVEQGGSVGDNFEAVGAQVTITGGTVGEFFDAFHGSTVDITGGSTGFRFEAHNGSLVNISGGTMGDSFRALGGSEVNISGGSLMGGFSDDFEVRGATVNITGGSIGDQPGDALHLFEGATVNISGGSVGARISTGSGNTVNITGGTFGGPMGAAATGSAVTISGGEFRLDDVPIEMVGSTTVPAGAVLSGTLADGTPFAFSSIDGDNFGDGVLTLIAAALPPVGPALITASTDAIPLGIRQGQTLLVDDGGVVADNFNAGRGSTVVVEEGGSVGDNFEAVGAQVTITGGTVGEFDAFLGSTVNITGGTVGSSFAAYNGSEVNISGGSVSSLWASNGSKVVISGGSVAENGGLQADNGSTVSISGGSLGSVSASGTVNISGGSIGVQMTANFGSVVTITGGTVNGQFRASGGGTVNLSGGSPGGTFIASNQSEVNLFGTDFVLDGVNITSSLTVSDPFTITDRDVTLSGLLADGSPFSFDLNSTFTSGEDFFAPGAILTVTLILPGDYNGNGVVDAADYVVWRKLQEQTGPGLAADGDGNFVVDDLDYDFWRTRFGNNTTNTDGNAITRGTIPEPCALALAAWATCGLWGLRRMSR